MYKGGSKPRYTKKWFVEDVLRLYLSGHSLKYTGDMVGISKTAVMAILERCGTERRHTRWTLKTCVDCCKPTYGLRCEYHSKIRNAAKNKTAVHRYHERLNNAESI